MADPAPLPDAQRRDEPTRRRIAWRYRAHGIFGVSCAAIMVVELVAGRLIAAHLGSSLYTWTAVIGVMLLGISVGNLVGGRLADHWRPHALLPILFLAASAACAAALGLNRLFATTRPLRGMVWPLQILIVVAATFLLPAVALGTLSPSLARMAVSRAKRVGATLGSFYAVGAVGSIVGTFLTGFYLLFVLGNTAVLTITALTLAALAVVSRLEPSREEAPEADRPASLQAPGGGSLLAPPGRGVLALPYAPHAIAFFASACLMAVELLASRIIAEQTGTSLYSWTSVIGVVLSGMCLGNYLGGVLSDRVNPSRALGWLFLLASVSCVGVLVLSFLSGSLEPFKGWHWPALVFTTVLGIFFVPSLLLGTFGPAATKVAVQRSARVGATIGAVSAWSAAGSILGTLASGFYLVPALGTKSLAMLVASLLACAGLVLGPWRLVQVVWVAAVCAGLVLTRVDTLEHAGWKYSGIFRTPATAVFEADSAYQHIRVYEDVSKDSGDRKLRVVALDYLIHGYVDLADPTYLNYDYERIYRDVARRYIGGRRHVSAFFLGGGSYTFPRWLLAEWPGSRAVVAEIDPLVVEANHQATGLSRTTPVRTIAMDARNAVEDLRPGERFDFVFGDAFNDLSVPYHLTTVEFTRQVADHLAPDGAYMLNVIDNFESGLLLGSVVNTLQRVFRHVYVFCTVRDGVGRSRDTFVVAASKVPVSTAGFEPNHETEFEGSILTREDIVSLIRKSGGRVLTDDSAPVENLIAPIVRARTREQR